MVEAKIVSRENEYKSTFECNNCGAHFTGYNCYNKTGQNKYCSRYCSTIVKRPNLARSLLTYNTIERKRVLNRDALIIEHHVNNPSIPIYRLAELFKTNYKIVNNSLSKYYKRGGDTVLNLYSQIDSEKAIELSKVYNI